MQGTGTAAEARIATRNVAAELAHGLFGQAGQRLVMAPTFLPALLFAASGSELLVGLARAGQGLGAMLTPAIAAATVGHRRHVKRIALAATFAGRLPLLAMALAAALLPPLHAAWFCVLALTAMGFANGFAQIALGQLRVRIVPAHRQGTVLGLRNTLGGLLAAALAALLGATLFGTGALEDPQGLATAFSGVFGLAFLLGLTGLLALTFVAEPAAEETRPRRDTRQTIADARALLRRDAEFARFFTAYALANVARMGLPFYILYAAAELEAEGGLSGALLGTCTTLWLLAGTSTRLLWGRIGDRIGHDQVLAAGVAVWAGAQLLLLASATPLALLCFFVLAGLGTGGFHTGANAFVLTRGPAAETAMRLAAVTTVTQAIAAVAPLLGGALGAAFGFALVFGLSIAAQIAALGLLLAGRPSLDSQKEYVP